MKLHSSSQAFIQKILVFLDYSAKRCCRDGLCDRMNHYMLKKKTAQTAACRNMNRVVCWFSISQIYLLFLCCFYVYVLLSAILQISFPPLWFFLVQ